MGGVTRIAVRRRHGVSTRCACAPQTLPTRRPQHIWRALRAPSALVVAALLALGVFAACSPPASERPGPSLTDAEREAYAGAEAFQDLFRESDRVLLDTEGDYVLSFRPLLKAIDGQHRFIVLDKLNVRNIYVFAADGSAVGRIGSEGKSTGQYVYPHTVAYSGTSQSYFVYDGDLLRVSEFGEASFDIRREFTVSLFIDQLLETPEGMFFAYNSSRSTPDPPWRVVHELDDRGLVVNTFHEQSDRFMRYHNWAASEGGGMAYADGHLYVITPFEYEIVVYDLSGRRVLDRAASGPHYVPPGPPPNVPEGSDPFSLLQAYHDSWSHIRQLLILDERIVGVVYAEPGEERVFLDLYELDLSPLARNLQLPAYVGDVLAHEESLYLLTRTRASGGDALPAVEVVRYRLAELS